MNKNLCNEKEDEIVIFFLCDIENGRNDIDGRDILIKIYCLFFVVFFVLLMNFSKMFDRLYGDNIEIC